MKTWTAAQRQRLPNVIRYGFRGYLLLQLKTAVKIFYRPNPQGKRSNCVECGALSCAGTA